MSYNISEQSIARVKQHLDLLVDAEGDLLIELPLGKSPSPLLYALRQGIASAEFYGIKQYAVLKEKFKFSASKDGIVCARKDEATESLKAGTMRLLYKSEREEYKEPADPNFIISTIVIGDSNNEIMSFFFENLEATEDELTKLIGWLEKKSLFSYQTPSGKGLLVSRVEIEGAEEWENERSTSQTLPDTTTLPQKSSEKSDTSQRDTSALEILKDSSG